METAEEDKSPHDYSKEIAAIYETAYNRGEYILIPSSGSPDWTSLDHSPPTVAEIVETIEETGDTLEVQISRLIQRASDVYAKEEDGEEELSPAVFPLIDAVKILHRAIELMDDGALLRVHGKGDA
tara:strand:+ start:92 stop:469 length:378 start_codon:yes stop_codon:yes gene_type:complete